MRTRNARDIGLFGSAHGGQTTWVKLEIDRDNGGNWVDLTDYYGDDWLLGVQYGQNIQDGAITATVTFASSLRGNPLYSLIPTMSSSIMHTGGVLIKKHRRIRWSVANVPMNDPKPASLDEVFDGRIDKWTATNGAIQVECRCMVVDLLSRFVEKGQNYGAEDPTTATAADIEEVMQNILDDHINSTASAPRANALSARTTDGDPWQIYSDNGDAVTPFQRNTTAAILLYPQQKEPIWAALTRLAETIQWRLSRRWLNAISDWALVFEEPTRTGASPVLTVDPKSSQARIRKIGFDGDVIRNVVEIGYQDRGSARTSYITDDPTSIGEYGRQYLNLNLGATSQVNTLTEATTMGDNTLADCKDILMQIELELPYVWYLQINDVLTIQADDIMLDSSQELAIVGLSHTIQQGGAAISTVTLEGAPSAGARKKIENQRIYPPVNAQIPLSFTAGNSMHTNGDFSSNDGI